MSFQFTKMQALGNDFVVINAVTQPLHFTPEFIRTIADRHYGIGCDQVLILAKAVNPLADFRYRIFNADGSEVSQCGNGARCMGLFIQHKKLSIKKSVILETRCDLLKVTACGDALFEVAMALPKFTPADIPFVTNEKNGLYTLVLSEGPILFDVVNVGNPHAVIRVDSIVIHDVEMIGAQLNKHPAFPECVNVGFMRVISPNNIELCVYERGAGITKACGSGASAAVAVGRKQGWLDEVVRVDQAGGELMVSLSSLDAVIQLRGPAGIVFDGDCSFS
ncbi:MAG: diaminopimelate epimerase [Coxiellaceae bacterium]|nr:diaminopimelate epimerase [Coxiellaceae bacterium]